jgi:hypothetical protein
MNSLSNHIAEALSDVTVRQGKMHKALGIPPEDRIKDHYTDPEMLVKDLYSAVGDKKEVQGMLAFVANMNSEEDIFDRALKYLDLI